MSRKRKKPSTMTLLAAALLCMPRRDVFGRPILTESGHLAECMPFEEAKKLTAKQIRARFRADHAYLHCWGGSDHPTNFTWRILDEDKIKTAADMGKIAKVRRGDAKRAELRAAATAMRVVNELGELNAKLDGMPKRTPDRRKGKAVIPGSRNSKLKKHMDGRVSAR